VFLSRPLNTLKPNSTSHTCRGLILTRHWHDRGDGQSLVYWLSTDTGPVRLEFTQQESVLFIKAQTLKNVQRLLGDELRWRHAVVDLRCFTDGEMALACYFRNQRDLGFARALLHQQSIETFEADIRPTDRFLMERFIRGTLEFSGDISDAGGVRSCLNPAIRRADYTPDLSVVSLDIETSITREIVLSIAISGVGINKVFVLGEAEPTQLDYIEFVENEKALIKRFLEWFRQCDPDVVIGWSIVGFDLKYLQDRCDALGIKFTLGREDSLVNWRTTEQGQQRIFAVVPGRTILDGIELLRTATYSFESFSLENVSRELLGRGKLVHDVDSRALEIEEMHRADKDSLARYNLEDCVLVLDIFQKTDLINFAVQRSCLTGLEMDRQGGSVAAFDYLYLPRLHREGFVAPVVDEGSIVNSPGGYVLDSAPGIYRDVIVLDFKSLYPSIIRTFHVDPLAMVVVDEARIPGFLDASFSKEHFILPRIIEELWAARDEAKRVNDSAGSQAIKIIMNSFYGVLGTPGCRFFDPRLASSITMRGHEILQKTRDLIEEKGFSVIYGDTDSVFVLIEGESSVGKAGDELASYLNEWWRRELSEVYQIESHLEIEFETHYLRFFMPTIRGSEKGSKKRYAGLVEKASGKAELVIKGLESVRSDWSPLARDFQQALFRRLFMNEPIEAYVIEMVQRVLDGSLDDKLTLRRRLRRKLEDYTKNVPPHVRAARHADERRVELGLAPAYQHGGWIEYVMTTAGPEPLAYLASTIDYEFYIDRQLAPIADAILGFQGTSLGALTDKQLGLF
jgi:DNA polymerase-2